MLFYKIKGIWTYKQFKSEFVEYNLLINLRIQFVEVIDNDETWQEQSLPQTVYYSVIPTTVYYSHTVYYSVISQVYTIFLKLFPFGKMRINVASVFKT